MYSIKASWWTSLSAKVLIIFEDLKLVCFFEYTGKTTGVPDLTATLGTSSEYNGPMITSVLLKSVAAKIESNLVSFLPVSKTESSISIPNFTKESTAIEAPK